MDFLDFAGKIILLVAALAFISGLGIAAVYGSVQTVQKFLTILSVFFSIVALIALIITKGLFAFLLFQFITLVLIWFIMIIIGAGCGGLIYYLRNKTPTGIHLADTELDDFLPLAEFILLEGITEQRAMARIKSGYYDGGKVAGIWYIHKSELSVRPDRQ